MPKQTSVNLDITNNPDGFDISGGTVSRKLALTGGNATFVGGGATYTLPSSSTTLLGGANAVTSFNGLTGSVTLTGDGGAVVGAGNNVIRARLADTSLTGVASFNSSRFSVNGAGQVDLLAAYQATGDTVITVVGSGIAISTDGRTDTLFNIGVTGVTTGPGISVSGTTGNIRISNMGVTSINGLTGAVTLTGDGGAIRGVENNRIIARLATESDEYPNMTPGSTGVATFFDQHFVVDQFGLVKLIADPNGGGGGGNACANYTNQATCEGAGCNWCENTQTCVEQFCSLFTVYGGIGASGNADGSLSYIYLDIGNLTNAAENSIDASNDFVLVYDASATTQIKTKKVAVKSFFTDNGIAEIFGTLSPNQLERTKGSSSLYYTVKTSNIGAGQEGLIKGGTAYAYITQNTVASIDGATGPITNVPKTNAANTFTALQSFSSGISASGGMTFNGPITTSGYRYSPSSFVTKTAGFTFGDSTDDNGKVFVMDNTTNVGVTVKQGLPVGFCAEFLLVGPNRVSFAADAGVTLTMYDTIVFPPNRVQIISYATDTYLGTYAYSNY